MQGCTWRPQLSAHGLSLARDDGALLGTIRALLSNKIYFLLFFFWLFFFLLLCFVFFFKLMYLFKSNQGVSKLMWWHCWKQWNQRILEWHMEAMQDVL